MGYSYYVVNHTKKEICGGIKKAYDDVEEHPEDPCYFEDQWSLLEYLRNNVGDMIQFCGEDSEFIEDRRYSNVKKIDRDYKDYSPGWPIPHYKL